MTIKNPKRFGLEVERLLADIKNSNTALGSLGISPLDLEVIHKSTNASPPVDYDDWRSLSRLKQPIFKILDRYKNDTDIYTDILDDRAGISGTLFGNLNINGRLSGNAIRYRYVKGSGNSATAEIADISTSRVSAWSSTVPEPIPTTAQISYGARIGIIASRSGDGGRSKLKFNTQRGVDLATGQRLKTTIVPQKVEFESEIPTSKVKIRLGGSDVWVYAMKGIPVAFRGFFRNLYNAWIEVATINTGSGVIQPSWKIVRPDNRNDYSNFTNRTNIYYYSVRSRERDIEIYYPPDSITKLQIQNANIEELPVVKFASMTYLNLYGNNIRTMPSLAGTDGIAPNLTYLQLSYNPLRLSDNAGERRLNQAVVDKMPSTLLELNIVGCFYGTISGSGSNSIEKASLFAKRFSSLKTFNVARGGGAYFHPDNDDAEGAGNCTLPNMPASLESYQVASNDFRRFSDSNTGSGWHNIKTMPNLQNVGVYGNYYLSDNISLATSGFNSSSLTSVNVGNTNMPMINMSGQANLTHYYGYYNRNSGTFFTSSSGSPVVYTGYKFSGCSKLKFLHFYNSTTHGPFPKFNHPELTYLNLTYTDLSGGGPDGNLASDTDYAIPRDTFLDCPALTELYILGSNFIQKPIHEDAFSFSPVLRYLRVYSYRDITGEIPSLNNLSDLYWLSFQNNSFTGNVPSFSNNPGIGYIYLDNNILSGTIPILRNLSSLDYLYLHNNRRSGSTGFTSLSEFENLPNLRRFYVHNNSIQGEIPDFTECPRLEYLTLFSNQFTTYKADSFKTLYYIRYIDVSSNQLSQQAINKIVDDLYDNYESVPRGRVTINMRDNYAFGNQNALVLPSADQLEKIEVLRNAGWTILIGS